MEPRGPLATIGSLRRTRPDSPSRRGFALGASALASLLCACSYGLRPEELPWCVRPVALAEGRLYPAGVLEPRGADQPERVARLYLPVARESERFGLGLARLPSGAIVVADVVRGGPAARAGLRQGMRLVEPADGPGGMPSGDLDALWGRLAREGLEYRVEPGGETRGVVLSPGARLLGRRWLSIPLLIDWECDQAGLSWVFPLGLVRLAWRQEEAGQGRLANAGRLELFWGLVRL